MKVFVEATELDWEFEAGEFAIFYTVQSNLKQFSGRPCKIIRRLTEDEADLFETGPMYHIHLYHGLTNGSSDYMTLDAFQDELTGFTFNR